jgi:drug/metabolite transporter (DMT)-like permease
MILLIWLRWSRGTWPRLSQRQTVVILMGGVVGVFGYGMFFMLGLARVPAGRAALVVTINPVFTTLIAAWLFKEWFDWKVGLGMALSVLGAAVVLTHGHLGTLLEGQLGPGEWLLLGCIACWVMYSLLGKRSMQGIDPLTVTTYTAVIGTVFLWMASIYLEPHQAFSSLNSQALPMLAAMAIGPTVLAYVWYFEGISKLGAGTASSYISLVPIFGVLMAAMTLNETLDSSVLLGGTMAIGGLLWMNWVRQTR